MSLSREDFRYYAAGRFVLGKGSVDALQLAIYVDGALMAWDKATRSTPVA